MDASAIRTRHERCPCCRAVWPVLAMWPDGDRWVLDCPICGPVIWRAVLTMDDYASAAAQDLLDCRGRLPPSD